MKLAIVGGSPSSALAPYNDPEFEIWALGNQADKRPRVDRLFEIHDNLSEHPPEYAQWLVDKNIPLVVSDNFPLWADHVEVYPEADTANLIGSVYLTSSPAYMLAYALLNGYKDIHFYGVDMAVDDHEYFKQRPCFEAWCGLARGMGVKLTFPKGCPVMQSSYREGRDWNNQESGTFSEAEFLKMAAMHQSKIEQLNSQIHTHSGAIQTYNRLAQVARALEAGQTISLTDGVVLK